MNHPATPPASHPRLSCGIRFRKGTGPRRRAVWGRYSPTGIWPASKTVFRKHPAGSGFPFAPEPATVSAPLHGGAGSLAIRKIRRAAMARSRRIRLLGATMICPSFTRVLRGGFFRDRCEQPQLQHCIQPPQTRKDTHAIDVFPPHFRRFSGGSGPVSGLSRGRRRWEAPASPWSHGIRGWSRWEATRCPPAGPAPPGNASVPPVPPRRWPAPWLSSPRRPGRPGPTSSRCTKRSAPRSRTPGPAGH